MNHLDVSGEKPRLVALNSHPDDKLLSIVVCTFDEKRKIDISELLESIRLQEYPYTETILIVEKSRDLHRFVVDVASRLDLNYRAFFKEKRGGMSSARNFGIERCNGEIIAMVDDDAILSPDWACQLIGAYRRYPAAIGVTGEARPLWTDESDSWVPTSLYWIIGCTDWRGWTREMETNVAAGVNMSFRTEVFKLAKFPVELDWQIDASTRGKSGFPNDENDFAARIVTITKRPIIFSPNVQVWHKVPAYKLKFSYVSNYALWQGRAEARYSRLHYSSGRQRLRLRVTTGLLRDILRPPRALSDRKSILKKLQMIVTVLFFYFLGYVTYSLTSRMERARLERTKLYPNPLK